MSQNGQFRRIVVRTDLFIRTSKFRGWERASTFLQVWFLLTKLRVLISFYLNLNSTFSIQVNDFYELIRFSDICRFAFSHGDSGRIRDSHRHNVRHFRRRLFSNAKNQKRLGLQYDANGTEWIFDASLIITLIMNSLLMS